MPRHTQDAAKKWRCSHASTVGEVYASAGSIVLLPNGCRASSSAAGSSGGANGAVIETSARVSAERRRPLRRSASTCRTTLRPGMPVTPPPPCVADPAW